VAGAHVHENRAGRDANKCEPAFQSGGVLHVKAKCARFAQEASVSCLMVWSARRSRCARRAIHRHRARESVMIVTDYVSFCSIN
jgi:hypothetical protein